MFQIAHQINMAIQYCLDSQHYSNWFYHTSSLCVMVDSNGGIGPYEGPDSKRTSAEQVDGLI